MSRLCKQFSEGQGRRGKDLPEEEEYPFLSEEPELALFLLTINYVQISKKHSWTSDRGSSQFGIPVFFPESASLCKVM